MILPDTLVDLVIMAVGHTSHVRERDSLDGFEALTTDQCYCTISSSQYHIPYKSLDDTDNKNCEPAATGTIAIMQSSKLWSVTGVIHFSM